MKEVPKPYLQQFDRQQGQTGINRLRQQEVQKVIAIISPAQQAGMEFGLKIVTRPILGDSETEALVNLHHASKNEGTTAPTFGPALDWSKDLSVFWAKNLAAKVNGKIETLSQFQTIPASEEDFNNSANAAVERVISLATASAGILYLEDSATVDMQERYESVVSFAKKLLDTEQRKKILSADPDSLLQTYFPVLPIWVNESGEIEGNTVHLEIAENKEYKVCTAHAKEQAKALMILANSQI